MLNTEVAMEAVKNIDLTILEYSHSAGNESYRTKLSASYISKVYQ
jgi:aspartate aminotransferase